MPRRRIKGTVVSSKMAKTVIVRVDQKLRHPLYKKVIKKASKFYVHDENSVAKVDDVVVIEESKPISKLKSWRLVSVV